MGLIDLLPERAPSPQEGIGRIVYEGRLIFGKYAVLSPAEEALISWKKEIDSIYELLKSRDVARLKALVGEARFTKYFGNIDAVLNQDLDETDYRLLAIGSFFLKNKAAYRGRLRGYAKLVRGGHFPMESSLQENGDPNCIDAAYMFMALAREYGINGMVKEISIRPYLPNHRYFATDDGRVLDVTVKPGIKRLGLFKESEYLVQLSGIRSIHYKPKS